MNTYNTSEIAAIFVENDSISSDGYMRFCDSQPNIHYLKRDFLYRGGLWREKVVKPYLFNRPSGVDALVLSHSDITTTALDIKALRLLGNKAVFATNCTSVYDRGWCLPLGLTNDSDDSPIHRILGDTTHLLDALRSIPVRPTFTNSVLLSFNPQTSPTYRRYVFSLLNNQAGITSIQMNYSHLGRKEYCELIRQHDFVLCPRGNGRDTHRLYEALYLGSIPIVKRGDLPTSLLCEFPVWVVDDWHKVLDINLRSVVRASILSKHWDVKKLSQSYWNSFIARHSSRNSKVHS